VTSNVARRYFEALGAHDLDAAVACWRPGGVDRLVGSQDLIAPEGIRAYFSELFAAFPDFSFQILQELVDGRESDRVALVSDLIYTLDPQTGIKGRARLPHPAFDLDVEQARASIRKLAAISPSVVWSGHADAVRGDVSAQLESAASTPA
jgi:predicted ester cyclase